MTGRDQAMTALDLEPIRIELRDILAKPPIRWGRHDAKVLIEQRIPSLMAEIDRLRQAANRQIEQARHKRTAGSWSYEDHDSETCGCGDYADWCPYNPHATQVTPYPPVSA